MEEPKQELAIIADEVTEVPSTVQDKLRADPLLYANTRGELFEGKTEPICSPMREQEVDGRHGLERMIIGVDLAAKDGDHTVATVFDADGKIRVLSSAPPIDLDAIVRRTLRETHATVKRNTRVAKKMRRAEPKTASWSAAERAERDAARKRQRNARRKNR